jgi:hypothetical protein
MACCCAGRVLRCRCLDGTTVGRILLRLGTGISFEANVTAGVAFKDLGSRDDTANQKRPLLDSQAERHRFGYGAFADRAEVLSPEASAQHNQTEPSAGRRGVCCVVLTLVVWPLRAVLASAFLIYLLLIEALLAPLEAWQRAVSRALIEDITGPDVGSDSDSDNDDLSDGSVAVNRNLSRLPPRNCPRSCLSFLSCHRACIIAPQRWCRCRSRALTLDGFDALMQLQRPSERPVSRPPRELITWQSTRELLQCREDASDSAAEIDPLDVLLEIVDTAGPARVVDFARLQLVRQVR